MLRERTGGTLERLLTTPIGKLDILVGYGCAFAVAAAVQAGVASLLAYRLLGLDTAGSPWLVALTEVGTNATATPRMWRDLVIIAVATVLALMLGAATLRRRTP